jgi:hypothetical protein
MESGENESAELAWDIGEALMVGESRDIAPEELFRETAQRVSKHSHPEWNWLPLKALAHCMIKSEVNEAKACTSQQQEKIFL